MYTNQFSVRKHLKQLFVHKYERYLPTAFDESMSILEKMNKLIEAQNALINVVNAHTEHTSETIERAFEIIDTNLEHELEGFLAELAEQKLLYEEIRDKIHSDLLPDSVRQKLEEWLLDGTIEAMITETVFPELIERVEIIENKFVNESIQLLVPTHYSNLNVAVSRATEYTTKLGVTIEVLIESGHKLNYPLWIRDGDFSNITISSEDAEVLLDDAIANRDLFQFINCKAPVINILVNAQGKCSHGLRYLHTASGVINSGCGVKNAGRDGLYARYASNVSANRTIFTGASQVADQGAGITAWGASIISAFGADVSGSKWYGVRSAHGSSIEFDEGTANDCGRHAMRASQQATLACRYATAQRAGIHALYALDGSIINGDRADLSYATNRSVFADGGSTITAMVCDMTGSGTGAVAHAGSIVNVQAALADGITNAVLEAERVSTINARNIKINGSQTRGAEATQSSTINMQNALIYGSRLNGVRARYNSTIDASISTIRNTQLGNESANGVRAESGSTVLVIGSTVWNNGGRDLYCVEGSTINATRCKTTGSVANGTDRPDLEDVSVSALNSISSFGTVFG